MILLVITLNTNFSGPSVGHLSEKKVHHGHLSDDSGHLSKQIPIEQSWT
jgi:hypothetical protein